MFLKLELIFNRETPESKAGDERFDIAFFAGSRKDAL
jgi:hypothetical protein